MRTVVFVAPFLVETTLRFVAAMAELSGVRLGLITQDPPGRVPDRIRARLAAHRQLEDALDPQQITDGLREFAAQLGTAERLVGVLEQLQVPLAEVREHLSIAGMGVEAARNFRDKDRMKSVLRAAGVPCARHGLAGSAEEARARAAEIGYPLVVKPPSGAGARDTFRVDHPGRLQQILGWIPPDPARPMLLEEFITGQEHSFDSVTIAGEHRWHSLTRYDPAPLEVIENPWIQWCVLLPREVDDSRYDDIRGVAARALDSLGMDTGLSHMEWFRRADGSIAISEVGARPPGAQFTTLISHAHDLDLYRAWARVVAHGEFDPPARRYAAGIAFLRGQGEGRVRAIHGLERAQRELGELVCEVRLPRRGQSPNAGYEGDGWVILRHPETAVVEGALRRVVALVRVELGSGA